MVFFLEPRIGAGLSGYVAEMASAFLCAELGIVPTVRHAD
jgi:antirestriction protein ArdC